MAQEKRGLHNTCWECEEDFPVSQGDYRSICPSCGGCQQWCGQDKECPGCEEKGNFSPPTPLPIDRNLQKVDEVCRSLLELHRNPRTANEWYTVLEVSNLLKTLGFFTPEDRATVDAIRDRYKGSRFEEE